MGPAAITRRRAVAGIGLAVPLAALAGSGRAAQLPPAPPAPAWRPLFDGRTMAGWTFFQEGVGEQDRDRVVEVRDGTLHLFGPAYAGPATPGSGLIATAGTFADYHLRLAFRWGERRLAPRTLRKRNSGLMFHMAPDRDRPWPDAVEFQIQEGDVGDMIGTNTRAIQGDSHSGAFVWPNQPAYGPAEFRPGIATGPITRQWLRKDGDFERLDDWNTLDLLVDRDMAAFVVNGRIVNSIYRIQRRDAGGGHSPLSRGRIGLQFEGAEIVFKDIMIRPLSGPDRT